LKNPLRKLERKEKRDIKFRKYKVWGRGDIFVGGQDI
jgi:hypothetical protein